MARGTFTAKGGWCRLPPSLFHSDRSVSYGHWIPRQRQAHMFLLRACFSSDVQDVSQGPGQHDLVKFGLTTADISHFNNFYFQESTVHLETELGSGACRECSCSKEPASPWQLGLWCQGSVGRAYSLMCTLICSLTYIPTYFYKGSPHIGTHPCAYPMCLYISHTYTLYMYPGPHKVENIPHAHPWKPTGVHVHVYAHTHPWST